MTSELAFTIALLAAWLFGVIALCWEEVHCPCCSQKRRRRKK
jgi:hypothetical protein